MHFYTGLQEEVLSSHLRAKLITAVAHAIFAHKNYPTSDDLGLVTQQMFQRWPFLKSAFGDVRYISLLHVYNTYVFHK